MPPTRKFENQLLKKGLGIIAGLDEVGIGPLAGPVVAAAVILNNHSKIKGLKDSKRLLPQKRTAFFKQIIKHSLAIGVGIVDWETIDRINILRASHLAMKLALESLSISPEHILIDGKYMVTYPAPQTTIIKGDQKCVSIASASIIAKVIRDLIMDKFDQVFPQYGFRRHKGYGTRLHMAKIQMFGPCPIHRRSFSPVCDRLEIHNPLDF